MYIRILTIGKLKNSYAELASEFLKRLGAWKVEVIELKDESGIEGKMDRDYFSILLDAEGKQLSSEEFAKFMERKKDLEGGKVCFVIGGAKGFETEFKKQFDMQLSLGKMTYTHQMARALLLEQLYRAFAIMTGKEYHY